MAFFKGEGNCLNRIVRWWTKSAYSHAELVLPDGITWLGISPFLKSKVASRKKLIIDYGEWDFLSISVTQEQVDIVLKVKQNDLNKGGTQKVSGLKNNSLGPLSIMRMKFSRINFQMRKKFPTQTIAWKHSFYSIHNNSFRKILSDFL